MPSLFFHASLPLAPYPAITADAAECHALTINFNHLQILILLINMLIIQVKKIIPNIAFGIGNCFSIHHAKDIVKKFL